MTLNITKLPASIGVGAQITFVDSVVATPSESGNNNRKLLAPVRRQWTCDISPDDALEIQKIIMATRGRRYAFAMVDPFANTFSNDILDIDANGHALLGKRWEPTTGPLSYFQRVMIPDGSLVYHLNGSPATPTPVDDYGVLNFGSTLNPLTDEPEVVSGSYLTPVVFMDQPTAEAKTKVGGTVVYQFSAIRLMEIFEPEFRALTA